MRKVGLALKKPTYSVPQSTVVHEEVGEDLILSELVHLWVSCGSCNSIRIWP